MEELTEFQKNIINVLVGGDKYGLAIKNELEEYYEDEVSHGRLYPNLDRLVNSGYVEKRQRDQRTNEYSLTDEAREMLRDEMEWRLSKYVGDSTDREKEVREILKETRTATEA
jgi:DNA-binding PadR family transcriptional regulator